MKTIRINLQQKYPIYIGQNLLTGNGLNTLIALCQKLANTVVIIADQNVSNLYGKPILSALRHKKLNAYLLSFIGGEKNKSRATKEALENKMLELKCGRDTCVIAVGGGITTDIAGFIAATYCRGIPVIYVPTSLLAMVDASIGGKTGVNTSFGKNLIGAFYQPHAVFIDISTLQTLPTQEFKNGIVELIKHALIKDEKLFDFLQYNIEKIKQLHGLTLEKIIAASCKIKKELVEKDEYEQGARQLCNLGHTVGHALEHITHYRIGHGAAVALGIVAESLMSLQLKLMTQQDFERIKNIFEQFAIKTVIPITALPQKWRINLKSTTQLKAIMQILKKAMISDKKAIAQKPYFVLLEAIGKPHVPQIGSGYCMIVPNKIIDASIKFNQPEPIQKLRTKQTNVNHNDQC